MQQSQPLQLPQLSQLLVIAALVTLGGGFAAALCLAAYELNYQLIRPDLTAKALLLSAAIAALVFAVLGIGGRWMKQSQADAGEWLTRAGAWTIAGGIVSVALIGIVRSSEAFRGWVYDTVLLPSHWRLAVVIAPLLLSVALLTLTLLVALQYVARDAARRDYDFAKLGTTAIAALLLGAFLTAVLLPANNGTRGLTLLAATGFFLAGALFVLQQRPANAANDEVIEFPGLFSSRVVQLLIVGYFTFWVVVAMLQHADTLAVGSFAIRAAWPALVALLGVISGTFGGRMIGRMQTVAFCAAVSFLLAFIAISNDSGRPARVLPFFVLANAMAGIGAAICTAGRERGALAGAALGALVALSIVHFEAPKLDPRTNPQSSLAAFLPADTALLRCADRAEFAAALQCDEFARDRATICLETSEAIRTPLTRNEIERLVRRCETALPQGGRLLVRLPATGFPGPLLRYIAAAREAEVRGYVLYGEGSVTVAPFCYLIAGRDIEAWAQRTLAPHATLQLFPVESKAQLALILTNLAVK